MVGLVTALASAWACDTAYSAADLAAELVLATRDHDAPARAAAMLPCVTEPLAPADAALYHRTMGAAAARAGDTLLAVAELRAARALLPDWTPPPHLVGPWARAGEESTGPRATIEEALVDGGLTTELWLDRASIVQRFEEGEWTTRYVGALAAVEPLAPAPEAPAAFPPASRRQAVLAFRDRPSVPLIVAGSTLLLASGVGYGVHVYWRSRFNDLDDPEIDDQTELSAVGNVANGALFAAWGGTALGGGLLAGGVLSVKFE